jgi:hypothetical protein
MMLEELYISDIGGMKASYYCKHTHIHNCNFDLAIIWLTRAVRLDVFLYPSLIPTFSHPIISFPPFPKIHFSLPRPTNTCDHMPNRAGNPLYF